jgi:Fe2+ or Zn2+ uptake regulation protein
VLEFDEIALRRLRDDGQRYTSGRRRIVLTLAEAGRPLTIPMILAREPALAQSSVYRNLAVLEHAGLVSKISLGDEHAHYELGEALTDHHHHHLVCRACGRVSDVDLPDAAERALDRAVHDIAARLAFTVESHRFDLVGVCGDCAAAAGPG